MMEIICAALESFERLFYSQIVHPRPRTRPMEIMALGLSRSGTDSLRNALLQLGYDHTYHGFDVPENPQAYQIWTRLGRKKWKGASWHGSFDGDSGITRADFDVLLGHCVAVTDMPAAAFALELIAAYPEAKIILNSRDVDAWYRSSVETFSKVVGGFVWWAMSWFCADLYWRRRVFIDLWDAFYYGSLEMNGKWVYKEHSAKIKGMVSEDQLLEWKVEDGWTPLCEFLGKNVPKTEFPSGNTPQAMLERVANLQVGALRKAKRNMILASTMVAVIAAAILICM